jgi:hypothetical protein
MNNEEKPIERAESKSEETADQIAKRKRLEFLALFGTIDFDPTYDYKAERKR